MGLWPMTIVLTRLKCIKSILRISLSFIAAPVTDNFILVTDFTHGKLYQIPLDKPREIHGIHPPGAVRLQDIAYSANTNEIYLVEEMSNEVWTVSVNGVWGVYIANLGKYILHGIESPCTDDFH